MLRVINGITLLSGKYSWVPIFLSVRCEEGRARPLEELESHPGLCWDWVHFSGGLLIHILNMQSYNKAKGTNNIPGTRELIVKALTLHNSVDSIKRLFVHACMEPEQFFFSFYDRKSPLDHLFPLKKGVCKIFSPHTATKKPVVFVREHLFASSNHQNCHSWVMEPVPDVSFVVLFSSLFSMAHLQNAPRLPLSFGIVAF